MNIRGIMDMPTKIDLDVSVGSKVWHESVTRSYHIVEKVKELLVLSTPPEVILELIELMQSRGKGEGS